MARKVLLLLLLIAFLTIASEKGSGSISISRAIEPVHEVNFSRDILPILSDRCLTCHGPDKAKRKADLRLDERDSALATGAILPGKSAESELIARVTSGAEDEVMPPPKSGKPLTEIEITKLRAWIDGGAKWGQHWAWENPVRPKIPNVSIKSWVKNPIDAFVLQKLELEKITPGKEANKAELLRRVYLDLTGLPPTRQQATEFLSDKSEKSYEKLVDKLLASPHYGERMAWDWLDAARYADTNGYQGDGERTMWPWRDWVVKAYNDDLPFDQFTKAQIAGDLLPKPTKEQLLATGFNRNHMINGEGGRIAEENRIEYVFDQTETVGTVWLGLTLTCARCHDHKYDPISRRDYYQLFAFFNNSPVNGGGGSGQTAPVLDMATAAEVERQKKATAEFDSQLKIVVAKEAQLREAGMVVTNGKYDTKLPVVIESTLRKGPNDRIPQNYEELEKYYGKTEPDYIAQLNKLRQFRKARDEASSKITRVMVMSENARPRDTFILTRGTYDKPEEKVSPKLPSAFVNETKAGNTQSTELARQNRLDLASWLVNENNPLTARVTVNRLWQMLFGTGLVKTTEDFGLQGQHPSHPELLDFLADEFREPQHGGSAKPWSIKHILRLIVTSATYRQQSSASEELWAKDPENRLLARGPRNRLPSWMIRDQALTVAGLLNPKMGGPGVKTYQPPGIWEEATFGNKTYQQDHGDALYRRSLYVFWRRIVGPTLFFDTANRQNCTVKSVITNTPLHALVSLNDTTYVEAARVLAQRVMEQGGPSDDDRIRWVFESVVIRNPNEKELAILKRALETQRKIYRNNQEFATKLISTGEAPVSSKLDKPELAAWAQICLMILNLDETLSKP